LKGKREKGKGKREKGKGKRHPPYSLKRTVTARGQLGGARDQNIRKLRDFDVVPCLHIVAV
jgi:hypothetical protein